MFDVYVVATVNNLLDVQSIGTGSITSTPTIAADLKSVQWYIPRFDVTVTKFTSQFTARIRNEINPNQLNIICSVVANGDSYPGAVYGQSGRNYTASSVSPALSVRIPAIQFIEYVAYIPTSPLASLSINEPTTFQFNLTIPEVTTSLTARILMPTGYPMVALEGDAVIGSALTCDSNVVTTADSDADGTADTLVYTFGVCVNTYDNSDSDSDIIIITGIGAPVDDARNVNTTILQPFADLVYGDNAITTPSATLTQSVTMTVIEPLLVTDPILSDRVTISDAGDVVRLLKLGVVLVLLS